MTHTALIRWSHCQPSVAHIGREVRIGRSAYIISLSIHTSSRVLNPLVRLLCESGTGTSVYDRRFLEGQTSIQFIGCLRQLSVCIQPYPFSALRLLTPSVQHILFPGSRTCCTNLSARGAIIQTVLPHAATTMRTLGATAHNSLCLLCALC